MKAAALTHGSTTPSRFALLYQSLGGVVLFTDVNRIWSRWSRFLSQSAANWSTEDWFKCLLVPRIAPPAAAVWAAVQTRVQMLLVCQTSQCPSGNPVPLQPPCSPFWAFPCTPNAPLRLLLRLAIQTGGCCSARGVSWNL